ncbi:MAG: sigma 54-interacting transcriptional regulator [Candidatus Eisenbacteria bacterium]|uniref:Sigma 54-interacting transcriptional regulator n=1 Tax=Eiseniibacteriota bacterium TaxID=2212470 RepID=A0A937XB59_UNCEI|nr:sigma 54-interacting transcriptional regulator [Candidatus Eisenbacteria bacterium]
MKPMSAANAMKTLLTFTGFHDPYALGLVGEQEQPGPVLSLAEARRFDRVILFATPRTARQTEATRKALAALQPQLAIEVREIALEDPTDYLAILRGLRGHVREIIEADQARGRPPGPAAGQPGARPADRLAAPPGDAPSGRPADRPGDRLRPGSADAARPGAGAARYFIAVASGTPQMHACWLLLAASGEIPAQVLNVRPPQFVTRERPLVCEVDLTAPEMPAVRAGVSATRARSGSARGAGERAGGARGRGGALGGGGEHGGAGEHPEAGECAEDPATAIGELGLTVDHPRMSAAVDAAVALAPSTTPILILGETGTGKELFARLVHRLSGRGVSPFVPVNCAAIPAELVESMLFGHVKGAFTGAIRDQQGLFVRADGGTLFLDEIGELPAAAQAKLLRVLEDGLIEPVGAEKGVVVDVRVVAATHRDLGREIAERRFREDLYYRVAVGIVHLPPLRERASDIPKLALQLLDRVNASLRRPKRLSTGALQRLQAHAWPGNVRDLENAIERSARLCPRDLLEAEDLVIAEPVTRRDPLAGLPVPHEGFSLEAYLGSARRHLFRRALEASGGNQAAAARLLDVSPQAVHKFVKGDEA